MSQILCFIRAVLTHKPQQHAEWTFDREKHGKRIWFSEDVSLQSRRNEVLSDGSHKRSHFLGWKSNPDPPESEKMIIFLNIISNFSIELFRPNYMHECTNSSKYCLILHFVTLLSALYNHVHKCWSIVVNEFFSWKR